MIPRYKASYAATTMKGGEDPASSHSAPHAPPEQFHANAKQPTPPQMGMTRAVGMPSSTSHRATCVIRDSRVFLDTEQLA